MLNFIPLSLSLVCSTDNNDCRVFLCGDSDMRPLGTMPFCLLSSQRISYPFFVQRKIFLIFAHNKQCIPKKIINFAVAL